MHIRFFWAILVVPALAVGAQAQTYNIKLKFEPDPGKSVVHREVESSTGSMKIFDGNGKLLKEDKPAESKEDVYTLTILEKGEKHPKKYKRSYDKASETKAGNTTAFPYQGRTLLFEVKDDKYQVTAEGTPALTEKDLEKLAKKATNALKAPSEAEMFQPNKPVKVGDSWAIDTKALAGSMDEEMRGDIDLAKSKAEATLAKVYQKDGKQFGVINVEIKLLVNSMGPLKLDTPATFEFKGALDTAIDGSTTAGSMNMTGKLASKAHMEQGGMKFTMEIALDFSAKEERSAEK